MPVLILPAAGALALAALALVILLAWSLFGKSMAHVIPDWHIPLLGSIQRAALTLIGTAFHKVEGAAEAAVRPIGHALYYPVHAWSVMTQAVVHGFGEVHATEHWITRVQAPRIYHRAVAAIAGQLAAVYRRISAVHVAVDAYVHYAITHDAALAKADAAAVRGWAATRIAHLGVRIVHLRADLAGTRAYVLTQARRYVDAEGVRVRVWTAVRLDHLSVRVEHLRADLAGATAHVLAQAHAYADRAGHDAQVAAINQLNTSATAHIAQDWQGIRDETDALLGEIGADFPKVAADLRDLPISLPTTVPVALSAALAAAIPMLRLARDCTVPNCRNLSRFGRDLADMEAAVEGVDVFAWLAEMVTHPGSAAADLAADLTGPAQAVVTDARDLLGV